MEPLKKKEGNLPVPGRGATASLSRPERHSPQPLLGADAGKILSSIKKIDTGSREFDYSDNDFERVRSLIYRRAGISLSAVKRDMVYSRLARRLRVKNFRKFSDYLDDLEKTNSAEEWEAFVNALTTNLTSFFREAHHFDVLADQMRKSADRRPFRIWCCAASTGEEPYSLAMTAFEAFGNNPPVHILASDLDTNVLAHGQKGVYSLDKVERIGNERIQRFFLKGTGDQMGHVKVRPELQRIIEFRQINLLSSSWGLRNKFDAIFCRNVMIYFDKKTQYEILEKFLSVLEPKGLLYAGHSENFIHAVNMFKSLGRTVYARTDSVVKR